MESMPIDGKFTAEDVASLRGELASSGLDSWQAAELVSSFLAARGYGISSDGARSVITRIDATHCTLECMQQELETLALVM
ncbi:hypothetical protein Terro_0984 [Terriglobus roseus DSM 18391]|uniref:Uncharacterized protein n=2 Tax=Terriglobus roseus TaxID=392734 RepID=I3ZDI7_TERRK|nr:hypothetical protein Terro_0984 [Terriglobus roseus DSM 18391]